MHACLCVLAQVTSCTMRMKWNNDVNEWTISDGSKKLTLKAPYNNNLNDWKIDGDKNTIMGLPVLKIKKYLENYK